MSSLLRVLERDGAAILREVERYGKLRAVGLEIDLVRRVRKVALALLAAFIGAAVFGASMVGAAIYALSSEIGPRFDGIFWGALAIGALCVVPVIRVLRERFWMKAFGIPRAVEELVEPGKAA